MQIKLRYSSAYDYSHFYAKPNTNFVRFTHNNPNPKTILFTDCYDYFDTNINTNPYNDTNTYIRSDNYTNF